MGETIQRKRRPSDLFAMESIEPFVPSVSEKRHDCTIERRGIVDVILYVLKLGATAEKCLTIYPMEKRITTLYAS